MGAAVWVIEKCRLQEATDYPMHQEAGSDADQQIPQEFVQWSLLSDRLRVHTNRYARENQFAADCIFPPGPPCAIVIPQF